MIMDAVINNDDPSTIMVTIGEWEIVIWDDTGTTHVSVEDTDQGSKTDLVLGKIGETQRL